jgi:hypothetical protein
LVCSRRNSHSRAVACEIVLCRALAIRIISVGWPFNLVTTECRANTKRAFGREKRAKTNEAPPQTDEVYQLAGVV